MEEYTYMIKQDNEHKIISQADQYNGSVVLEAETLCDIYQPDRDCDKCQICKTIF